MEAPSLVVVSAGERRRSDCCAAESRFKPRRWCVAGLHLLALLCVSGPALAEPSVEQLLRARDLFNEAERLEGASRWPAAALKLEEAISVKETPGLRYHLAFCQQRMGQLVKALGNYERAGALIAAGAAAPDVSDLLGAARADLEARIPTLRVRVSESREGVRVLIDEQPVAPGQLGRPVRLDPGTHRVRIDAADHHPLELEVTLAERERRLVEPKLEPRATPTDRSPEMPALPADASQFPGRTVALAAGATVTLAALGAGIGYSVARAGAERRADDARAKLDERDGTEATACYDPKDQVAAACAELADANRDGLRASDRATVGFVAAGIAAAATAATWYFWEPEGTATSWAVGGGPTAGLGLRLRLTGSF